MIVYLVGGAVRDLLLGNQITDRDYLVTQTTEEDFIKRFPLAQKVGKSFPIFLVNRLEFSFLRAENLDKELESRDLTVNALLIDGDGNLICHPSSLDDLYTKTLRPASTQSFVNDPLRVFRAARLWCRYPDFSPHNDLISIMSTTKEKGLLSLLSADRVGAEVRKSLSSTKPGNFLRLLHEANCLSPWLDLLKPSFNKSYKNDLNQNIKTLEETCDLMDKLSSNELAAWMSLCHHFKSYSSNPFDEAPSLLARKLALQLRLPNTFVEAGEVFNRWLNYGTKYLELCAEDRVDLLLALRPHNLLKPFFATVTALSNHDYTDIAQGHLHAILEVRLAPEHMNLGPASGKKLRQLRASRLKKECRL